MQSDFNYPIHVGEWGNPLDSSYVLPIVKHLTDIAAKYPVASVWVKSGAVGFLDRTVSFVVPAGQTLIQASNLTGGFNALILDRRASVVVSTAPGAGGAFNVLPSREASYVTFKLTRKDGEIDTEQAPMQNNVGFGWEPDTRPAPEFWSGADVREITLSNNTANDVTVFLTFTMILL
jgi:hypothetical protein